MKKKVTFLIRDLNYAGAQRQVVTLAKALNKECFDISVLHHYSNGPLEKDLKDANIVTISLEKWSRWDIVAFFWHLVKDLKRIKPDILHGYLGDANLLTIFLKPFFPSTKMIWGLRNSNNENPNQYGWVGLLLDKLNCLLSPLADLIIVNSHAGRAYSLTKGYPAEKMVVIPNGIDTECFKPDREARARVRAEWKISVDTLLLGVVGRLDPMKDYPNFLQAAALLCQERKNIVFVCVGKGPEDYARELQQLTAQLSLSEQVIWAGTRADMPAVYNALDIYVSASAYGEGFSNALGEAMACGLPCIVTDVGDSAWIVGDTGVVVPPKNPQALANAIRQMIETIDDRHQESIRQRIINHFSVPELAKKTEAVFCQVLKY
jgi:glycosyltransferase involved in cell wall biosynthesis